MIDEGLGTLDLQPPPIRYALQQSDNLFLPSPCIGLHGGRGAGKSEDVATYCGEEADTMYSKPLLIVCGREILDSIDDSCKSLIESKLCDMGIIDNFKITNRDITHRKYGNKIIFKGVGVGVRSIKSIHGANIFWGEEAQEFSHKTMELLPPSIRGIGAKMIFTWNPDLPSDPIEEYMRNQAPEGTLNYNVNYYDNRFFPKSLQLQMDKLKEVDTELYEHVWLGKYRSASTRNLFPVSLVDESKNRVNVDYVDAKRILGVDIARFGDDSTVLKMRHGFDSSTPCVKHRGFDSNEVERSIKDFVLEHKIDTIVIDCTGGHGTGPFDHLKKYYEGTDVEVIEYNSSYTANDNSFLNARAECYVKFRDWMRAGGKIHKSVELVAELQNTEYFYTKSKNQIQIEAKDKIKDKIKRSPDESDAEAMTHFVDDTKPNVNRTPSTKRKTAYRWKK